MKCDNCLNSRGVISENGLHSVCCLSDKKAMECIMGKKDHRIGLMPRLMDGADVPIMDVPERIYTFK